MTVDKAQIGARVDGTGAVFVNDIQVVGEQAAHVVDLSAAGTPADLAAAGVDLDAIIVKVNAILVVLETHGLVASS
jgi:hypothetical protein